jgi:DNA topoisomerase 2-associated protein PAT1
VLNDDTFGGGPATQQSIGRDFDFAGKTSQISNTMQEEQMLFQARQKPAQYKPPVPQASKPNRTGYESYKDPEYIPQLEVRADIWGLKPKQPAPQRQPSPQPPASAPRAAKNVMSVDEIEAMMRVQSVNNAPRATPPPQQMHQQGPPQGYHQQQYALQFPAQHGQQYPQQHPPQHPLQHAQQHYAQQQYGHGQTPFSNMQGGQPGQFAPQILQRPHQQQQQQPAQQRQQPQPRAELPAQPVRAEALQPQTILQRQTPQTKEPSVPQPRQAPPQLQSHALPQGPPTQPRQILQNPQRLSGHGQPMIQNNQPVQRGQVQGNDRGPSFPIVTHPEQILQLSEADRAQFLENEAKRAKRNHKISLLAKDNGLMTPQDKNFITRIQLQQLMTATGNLDERGPEAAIAEDFYYQVFRQIRGAPRQNPQQPANQFAQTYLFQTNNRFGRRPGRGGDNHMQRMEQQIQRAVEAAKARPKARSLVVEGSLGKIAFSNSKTPRPLLNIKRSELGDKHFKHHKSSVADRKQALRDIENVYITLMKMEDHERAMPPPINEGSHPEAIQAHMEWRSKIEALHKQLWLNTKIMEPINPQYVYRAITGQRRLIVPSGPPHRILSCPFCHMPRARRRFPVSSATLTSKSASRLSP